MAAWFNNRKGRGSSPYAQRGMGTQAFMGTNSDTAGAISVRTHAMATNWEAEGLPSYEAASILGKIMDPSTGPADRSSLFAALSQVSPSEAASSLTSQSTGPPRVAFAGVTTSGVKRVRTGATKLYSVLITTFQRGEDWTTYAFNGAVQRSKAYLPVSEGLPFVAFQLGEVMDPESSEVLEGGCDSMCGASIGNLKYHKNVVAKYPHLVAQYACLDDLADQKGFDIGGIDGRGGTRVTHIVSYKTPYKKDGKQVLITLGLGDFGVKTLFSYPFLKSLKASILLESGTLVCGAIGTAFKMSIKRPELPTEAPTASAGVPVALMAPAPNMASQLSAMSSTLISAFKELSIDSGSTWEEEEPPETTKA